MRLLAAALATTALLAAQPGADPWSGLRSKNPPGLELSLRLLDPHEYRQGELIRMEAKGLGGPLMPSPQEFWQFAGFLLDPPAACGSLQKPCFTAGGGPTGGGIQFDRTDLMSSFRPGTGPLNFALNSYVPPLPSGHYRAALLARTLELTERSGISSNYDYANPPRYAVSNAVEFEVVPASDAWIRKAVAHSVAVLKGPQPRKRDEYERRRWVALQLGFLDGAAAWQASLGLLPVEEATVLRGLAATRHPARVCRLMQSRVPLPAQFVSSYYLSVIGDTCERAQFPPLKSPASGQPGPDWRVEVEKRNAFRSGLIANAAASLAASLPQKQPEAKSAAFDALLQHVRQSRYTNPSQPAPQWLAGLSREFVQSFERLDVSRQRHLLELYAAVVNSPDVVPLAESIIDRWKPGDYYETVHEALHALYTSDRARAQTRILAELTKPQTWLDTPQLEMLPAAGVPPIDNALIDALAAAQRSGGWNPQLRMAALAKYATPHALPRIKAIYESQLEPCQPELVAYFVRVDPKYADRVFHSHQWDMQVDPPPCTVQYFQRTAPLAMGPPLEKYMAAYLMHKTVFIKTAAARSLGLYGSPAALPALWDALRYFHEYWAGNAAELNGEGAQFEAELRNAIAHGTHWKATDTDLRLIESLCTSARCFSDTRADLAARH
jgi:hypothetical protein